MDRNHHSIFRIELKDIFKQRDKTFLERKLLLSNFGFYKPYPNRRINSLYFDSFDNSSIFESIEGSAKRVKKRLRWYGKLTSETFANLEYKIKNSHLSRKNIQKKFCEVNPKAMNWLSFTKSQHWRKLTRDNYSFPASIVSYDRTYYQSANKKVRVTFDENLTFLKQELRNSPNTANYRALVGILVVEIKVAAVDHASVEKLQKIFPFSPKRFSKYCESLLPRKPILS